MRSVRSRPRWGLWLPLSLPLPLALPLLLALLSPLPLPLLLPSPHPLRHLLQARVAGLMDEAVHEIESSMGTSPRLQANPDPNSKYA